MDNNKLYQEIIQNDISCICVNCEIKNKFIGSLCQECWQSMELVEETI